MYLVIIQLLSLSNSPFISQIISKEDIIIYTQIISYNNKIKSQIQNLESKLNSDNLPSGNLICTRNGKHSKWYQKIDNKYTYIPKNNFCLASQLAYKKYLYSYLSDLRQEQLALEAYIKKHPSFSRTEQLLTNETFQTLLKPHFIPLSPKLDDWTNEDYDKNTSHPEHLIHKSNSGHLLRSKTESIIDMLLYINQIPFRYECSLTLGETTLYPDFTIRHPQTGDIYYWEHFGLMDNPNYIQNTYSKLQLYSSHGIIPTIQLITTYETKNHPIDVDTISKIIENYFL